MSTIDVIAANIKAARKYATEAQAKEAENVKNLIGNPASGLAYANRLVTAVEAERFWGLAKAILDESTTLFYAVGNINVIQVSAYEKHQQERATIVSMLTENL